MLFPRARDAQGALHVGCFRAMGLSFRALSNDEIDGGTIGWRLATSEGSVLRYVLPTDAPFGEPRVYLEAPDPEGLNWRNVEADGRMCLFPPGENHLPTLHPAAVRRVLSAALEIVAQNRRGDAPLDAVRMRQGWITKDKACWSLIPPDSAPCDGIAARAAGRWLIAASEDQLRAWMKHSDARADHAVPVAARKVAGFDEVPTDASQLDARQAEMLGKGGLCLFFLDMGTGPIGLAVKAEGDGSLARYRVDRADRAWLHERGGKGFDKAVGEALVTVVGCGSLGAGLAALLAQAGVGRLSLIDPDTLRWDNVGRHVLGGGDVGRLKVEALARHLRRHLPTITRVQVYPSTWQDMAAEVPSVLNADVIVSTIASWPDELGLAEWARCRDIPLVLGWIEGHAVAGHALALKGECLACQFTPSGGFRRAASWWPDTTPIAHADACHESYFPYGYSDILPVQSMIASLVSDVLAGRVKRGLHRSRLPNLEGLRRAGAQPTKDFETLKRRTGLVSPWQEIQRDLPRHHDCWYCADPFRA